jgi:hypothetical protein
MSEFDLSVSGVDRVRTRLSTLQDRLSESATWVVGTNVSYSVYVEFGTRHMAAQPYLRPAVEHVRRNADSIAAAAETPAQLVAMLALEVERYAKRVVPVDTGNLRSSIRAVEVS